MHRILISNQYSSKHATGIGSQCLLKFGSIQTTSADYLWINCRKPELVCTDWVARLVYFVGSMCKIIETKKFLDAVSYKRGSNADDLSNFCMVGESYQSKHMAVKLLKLYVLLPVKNI